MGRLFCRATFALGALIFSAALIPLAAQSPAAPPPPASSDDSGGPYVAPAGSAPPVAPPLSPNSPLYHLAHDPKYTVPTVGYREGNTSGAAGWIGHRGIDTDGGEGWGWIKKSNGGGWRWIALQETPGLAIAPHRRLAKADADADWEFHFWGYLADYKAYDPHLDELVPVFVLQGYDVIGPAAPLRAKIGPPDRRYHAPSGASSRPNRPILSDPRVD